MRRERLLTGGLLVVAVLAVGCGGPVNVQGRVVKDGKPVADAMVLFHPVKGGQEAGDQTDEEGRFRVKNPQRDGIIPGEYKVTVSKKVWPPGMKVPTAHEMTIPMMAKQKESMPMDYISQEKTPLKVTIPRGGVSDLVLEIK